MLDTTLFNVQMPSAQTSVNESLVLTGCIANLSTEENVYSEFDELNSYSLNCNDYGYGRMNVEFCFENSLNNPYFEFFARCFTIRTDNGVIIKINRNPTPKILSFPNYTKVNKDNKLAIGISYYFQNKKEREKILDCRLFCIEGFIALKKKTNVYGIMCTIEKAADTWRMREGNTYRIYKRAHINNLWH